MDIDPTLASDDIRRRLHTAIGYTGYEGRAMFVRAVDWALFDRIFSASAGWKTVHTRQRALSTAIRRQLGRGNTGTYAPTHITVSEVMCFFVVVMHV